MSWAGARAAAAVGSSARAAAVSGAERPALQQHTLQWFVQAGRLQQVF
jgi:hypothetical protein